MSYLLDRKKYRKRVLGIFVFILVAFLVIYFNQPIARLLGDVTQTIFRPLLIFGKNVGGKIDNTSVYFRTKDSLFKENELLKTQIQQLNNTLANYNTLFTENESLKEILGRKSTEQNTILAGVLAKPNRSAYDTLLIDVGENEGVYQGSLVLALGDVPLGRVEEVYARTAKIKLFSTAKEETEVVVSSGGEFMVMLGRGGGNFEMILPRDFEVVKGEEVVLPGIEAYAVALVETVISDPRDAYKKALLVSPVNIQHLKFVEVVK